MRKTALVTGGNSGIGYASAKLLKEKGYTVFISGRHNQRLQQAASELQVEAVLADMSKPADIEKLAATFVDSGLDVLVNNAGIAKFIPIQAVTEADCVELFNVNVQGPLLLIKALLPSLEKQQGCVVNVSSIGAQKGIPTSALYSSTKGAVESFTRTLAVELAPIHVRVNAVSPGPIDTPILGKMGVKEEDMPAFKQMVEATVPMQRFGQPEEIAQVILSQIEASYVTGAVWAVDGGGTAA